MTDVRLTCAAAFDRKFFREGGQSVRYLVVRLKAGRRDARRPAERVPLNIALVIDASGSMGGGKLDAAKEAALGLAERLTERDRLTVVSFASDVQVHLDAVAVTAENAARIRAEISRLKTRDMTFLSGGWFAGVERAARIAEEDARMTPRIIILSDGHANEGIVDREELCKHARELRLRGVLTSALGVGDGYDELLLRGIAENGGGRLHDAEFTTEISSVLLGELGDISETLVEEAQIALAMPAAVRIEHLGAVQTEFANGRALATLGPVQNTIERIAVFKVTCPEARRNDELKAEIAASGRAVDDRSMLKAETVTVSLVAADDGTNKAQPRDEDVAEIVARIWSGHIVSTAAQMNRDEAYQDAERYIERELRYFRRYVEGLERGRELIQELELLAQRAGRAFSSRTRKEMVLQASLASESRTDHRGVGKASWSARLKKEED